MARWARELGPTLSSEAARYARKANPIAMRLRAGDVPPHRHQRAAARCKKGRKSPPTAAGFARRLLRPSARYVEAAQKRAYSSKVRDMSIGASFAGSRALWVARSPTAIVAKLSRRSCPGRTGRGGERVGANFASVGKSVRRASGAEGRASSRSGVVCLGERRARERKTESPFCRDFENCRDLLRY